MYRRPSNRTERQAAADQLDHDIFRLADSFERAAEKHRISEWADLARQVRAMRPAARQYMHRDDLSGTN